MNRQIGNTDNETITPEQLWRLFDEECEKLHITGLLFGDGLGRGVPASVHEVPKTLTVWENICKRLNTILKDEAWKKLAGRLKP